MNARFLDVLHDAPMTTAPVASAMASTSNSKASRGLVDEHRVLRRRVDGVRHVSIERVDVVDDRHPAPAKDVRRPDHDRESDGRGRRRAPPGARLRAAAGCVISMLDKSGGDRFRSSARSIESGDVPRIATPACWSASASLSGVCPPNCTRHDTRRPPTLRLDDAHHILGRWRLEVQPIGRVVVGRHRFRIAVDHHRLEAFFAQGERRVTAAVIELDSLADAVGSAAEDDHLFRLGGIRLADVLVRAVQVRRERLEFGPRRCPRACRPASG